MKYKILAAVLLAALLTTVPCNAAETQEKYSYYEECPQLPIPSSCLDLTQGFSMRSSINGVTSSSYGYSAVYGSDLDITKAADAYLEILKEEGLEVKETSESSYEVYEEEAKLAEITVGAQLTIAIGDGNAASDRNPFSFWGENSSQKPASQFQDVALGDTIALDFVTMTLDKIITVDELYPEDISSDNYYYLEDEPEKKYLCLKGTIKNTGSTTISSQAVNARVTINDRYTNRYGQLLLSSDPKEVVGYKLAPGEEGTFCLCFSVTDEALFFLEKADIRFGFNENFQSGYGSADYIYELPFSLGDISGRSM